MYTKTRNKSKLTLLFRRTVKMDLVLKEQISSNNDQKTSLFPSILPETKPEETPNT